ncbi:MAG: DUF4342 domain-containing protein [Clostridia bacterium]|nr:DUF4342 domain-containing protein [Clostridia bacterium]
MEITLEKIELVKDRTGVTYKEAKDALIKADGDVVEAIILIEGEVNQEEKTENFAKTVVEKVKELINKGNVTKISIKRDGDIIANVPVNVGIVGALLAPWGVVAAAVATFGFRCTVELSTNEGEVIDVTEKVKGATKNVKEKSDAAWTYAKEKTPEAWSTVKGKGETVLNDIKGKAPEFFEKAKEKGEDLVGQIKEKGEDLVGQIKEKFEKTDDDAMDILDEIEIEIDDEAVEKDFSEKE